MAKLRASLHSRVHKWIDKVGFSLNSQSSKDNVTTKHYFFETFNLIEKEKQDDPAKSKYLCFDVYGEKIPVRSLLDLQSAFFDNLSKLK
ncbi:hypothetical protein [Mucilaginibacter defluvii]|uniref:Uncharacterized protein n=1 Tax=Mucilaginibacter defluvii TaxID=1196019 RepID=A0ABP9G4L8_9SPHI